MGAALEGEGGVGQGPGRKAGPPFQLAMCSSPFALLIGALFFSCHVVGRSLSSFPIIHLPAAGRSAPSQDRPTHGKHSRADAARASTLVLQDTTTCRCKPASSVKTSGGLEFGHDENGDHECVLSPNVHMSCSPNQT